ncbi:MAG: hypothetical protein LLF98_02465 [Clostridium sp.]|uniref:hypothetical protein n=1 Tax=Clostridium sp. TaxID=1506 RepID=UPI0025BE03C6|nr:hypothetical protein [Clostridium sp.]MCE5220146.1 hypothetical protein [Clostridium sp.]
MKRLLMLKPNMCASGDTKEGKIYEIIEDYLSIPDDEENDKVGFSIEYSKENALKYLDAERWVKIKDESSEDDFEAYEDDDRFIIFENDKELAHELINRVEGLDKAIVNVAVLFMKA